MDDHNPSTCSSGPVHAYRKRSLRDGDATESEIIEAVSGACGSTSTSPGFDTPEKAGLGKHKRARIQCSGGSDSGSYSLTRSGTVLRSSELSPSSTTSGRVGGSPAVRAARARGGAKCKTALLLSTEQVEAVTQASPTLHARNARRIKIESTKAAPSDGADQFNCTDATFSARMKHDGGAGDTKPAGRKARTRSRAPSKVQAEARDGAGECAAEPASVTAKPAVVAEDPAAAMEPAVAASDSAAANAAEVSWGMVLAMDDTGRLQTIQAWEAQGVDWTGTVWHDEMEMRFYR